MSLGVISGVVTGLLFATFVGGWLWAWSGARHEEFHAASRLPLDEHEREIGQ